MTHETKTQPAAQTAAADAGAGMALAVLSGEMQALAMMMPGARPSAGSVAADAAAHDDDVEASFDNMPV